MPTDNSDAQPPVRWPDFPLLGYALTSVEEWLSEREELNRAAARLKTLEQSRFSWLDVDDVLINQAITPEAYSLLKRCLARLDDSLYEMATAIAKARSPESADSSTPVPIEDHHLEEAGDCLAWQLKRFREHIITIFKRFH